jgi:transposase
LKQDKGAGEIRTFRTVTKELLLMRQWLLEESCTHVGMESTGVLWRPIYDRLAGYFERVLVNAAHMRQVPGHKTDVQDADWLADLLQHGLLKPSFAPDQPQQDLRDLTRLRLHLIQDRTQLINRIRPPAGRHQTIGSAFQCDGSRRRERFYRSCVQGNEILSA